MKSKRPPRRDLLDLIGRRAARLTPEQRALAWADLARRLEDLGAIDLPKFKHVVAGIRAATIAGRQAGKAGP